MTLRKWAFAAVFAASTSVGMGQTQAPKPVRPAAQKPVKHEAFIDAEKAGPAFKLQGEYVGQVGGGKLGAQVIAYKDGKFHAVFYAGGLPGDGSEGKNRVDVDGAADDASVSKATFNGRFTATLGDGKITGKTDKGEAFELTKVMRVSPTLGAKAPAGAVVLFDGTNTDAWKNGRMDDRHLLVCGPTTKQEFTDFSMHIEFINPFMPSATGQARGNSGVYIQGRYELQVLDSFGLRSVDNECGGIYKNSAPAVLMSYPPLSWQTYDIDFTAAKWDGDKKLGNAVITVKHNGVVIQDKLSISGPTPGGPKSGAKENSAGPIFLQDHGGDPVVFRNVWVVEKK